MWVRDKGRKRKKVERNEVKRKIHAEGGTLLYDRLGLN